MSDHHSAAERLYRLFVDWPEHAATCAFKRHENQEPDQRLDLPTGQQLEILAPLLDIYRVNKVLAEFDFDGLPPLETDCVSCKTCWNRGESGYNGGKIVLPYVGPGYQPEKGVLVLGMNLRDANYALLNEFETTSTSLAGFRDGSRWTNDSLFAYRATRSAAALIDSLAGRDISATDHTEPGDLCAYLLQTARLQAVKCSPNDTGPSMPPYNHMYRQCWNTFIQRELDILRPAAILSVGRKFSQWVLHPRDDEAPRCHGDGVETTTIRRGWGTIDLYTTYHPRASGWTRSHERLVTVLQECAHSRACDLG